MIVGTINSPLQEPNRLPLSGPVKRRTNVIPMPDRLADAVTRASEDEAAGRVAFEELCNKLLAQLRDTAAERAVSVLDKPVVDSLQKPVSATTLDIVWAVARALTPQPQLPLTLGLVQSILGYVQLAPVQLTELAAIDCQLVQKVLPVMRGDPEVLDLLATAIEPWAEDLPDTMAGIAELTERATGPQRVTPTW
jgi:hypothetical protein